MAYINLPLPSTGMVMASSSASVTGSVFFKFFNGFTFPFVSGKPVFDDPIKKIKNDMGYQVEPDRYEKSQPFDVNDMVSVQPMTAATTGVFTVNYIGDSNEK